MDWSVKNSILRMYASKGYTKEVELLFGEVNMVVKGFGFLEYFDFLLLLIRSCHKSGKLVQRNAKPRSAFVEH